MVGWYFKLPFLYVCICAFVSMCVFLKLLLNSEFFSFLFPRHESAIDWGGVVTLEQRNQMSSSSILNIWKYLVHRKGKKKFLDSFFFFSPPCYIKAFKSGEEGEWGVNHDIEMPVVRSSEEGPHYFHTLHLLINTRMLVTEFTEV